MEVITLHQPWASLVALGVKTVITRPDSTSYVGPVTIFATNAAIVNDDPYIRSVLASAGFSIEALPLGVALATSTLVDCQKVTRSNIPCYPEYAFSDFIGGWYVWKLSDINVITH